ncbi:MAG: hypothetical protein KGY80_04870 [Candidatus Thorarchaeota archaeon]|nr:hypothetical protein [Candidatus Thorarchaeota archaeon]
MLRIASTALFAYMAWLVYTLLYPEGIWSWAAPYVFVVTVFRLLSLLVFLVSVTTIAGLLSLVGAGAAATNELVIGLYNTLILRMWYLQPYGVSGPLTSAQEVFASIQGSILTLALSLWDQAFIFLYFFCAGVGVALFLQSLYRLEHRFVGGAFIAIQSILVVAAFRNLGIPNFTVFPTNFIEFATSSLQILALVSFAYLEVSYQMVYSYSVGKPVEDREETLKKQLLALRQATRKQAAIEREQKISSTSMSRSSGATVFSYLREAIERQVLGDKDVLENLDAISDVRRLQHYVDDLLEQDPQARDELTARAAAPSQSYVIGSTIVGSGIRLVSVVLLSFVLLNPRIFLSFLELPPGIANSVELLQPEIVLLLLVPVVLLFPFAALVIGWVSKDEEIEELEMTDAEREQIRIREERKKRLEERGEEPPARTTKEEDDWDAVLEETFGNNA